MKRIMAAFVTLPLIICTGIAAHANGDQTERLRLEAAPGFEPGNNGFADRRLSHLAMPPSRSGIIG